MKKKNEQKHEEELEETGLAEKGKEMHEAFHLQPDSAFPFSWFIISGKTAVEQKVIGMGQMDGVMCKKQELFDWVGQQFAAEQSSGYIKLNAMQQTQDQIDIIKRAVEEGLEVLEQVSSHNNKLSKEIRDWKKELLK